MLNYAQCLWHSSLCFANNMTRFSPNITIHNPIIYNQNEEWELPIGFLLESIYSVHPELPEFNAKYLWKFRNLLASDTIYCVILCILMWY